MDSIEKSSGLPIKIREGKLDYDKKIFEANPKPRLFSEAQTVYQETADPDLPLYYMYRYFEKKADKSIFETQDAEYDITLINPGKIGDEYIKTKGHYHPLVPDTDISYPEVYEVIAGKAEYLIQKRPNDNKETDVIVIKAKSSDKIVIPPNYGHVSINVGDIVLISSNIQKRDLPTGADYGGFEYYHGGAMYRTETNWVKNPEYKINSLRYVYPVEKPKWGLTKNKPLYQSFIENPEKFKWLTKPQDFDFSDIWAEIN